MATAELIARLNSKSNIFDPMPSGAAPLLTEHDIAAALGMCKGPNGIAYLIRVKWAKQQEYLSDLVSCLYLAGSDQADYSTLAHKRSHYPGLIFDLSRMAVAEYCITTHVCQTCEGRKEAIVDSKVVKCGECGGSGLKNRDITRPELIGQCLKIHTSAFYRTWGGLYNQLLDIEARWEQVGLGAISHRLNGGRDRHLNRNENNA